MKLTLEVGRWFNVLHGSHEIGGLGRYVTLREINNIKYTFLMH